MLPSALLTFCVLLAQPEPAGPPVDVAGNVRRLIRQLDDEALAKRDAAEKELTALGPAALDHLPVVTAKLSTEVKDRLARVRRALENTAVETATKPARVTLKGEMSLAAALASLEKQSGNKIVDFREEFGQTPKAIQLTLNVESKTLWEALDTVLDQAEMTVYNFAGKADTIAVVARAENEVERSKRAAYGGMFRFEATQIEAVRDLRNPANHSLRLALDVAWEPRLKPIALVQPLNDLKALNEQDQPLSIDGSEGESEVATEGDASATELYVPLQLPDRAVRKIKSLQGKLTVLTRGRVETFEFSDLEKARDVEQKRAGVTVIFERMRKNGDVFDIRIRVKFDDAKNALESHRGWIYGNPAHLVDPDGKVIENGGLEATLQAKDEVGISYKFALDNPPTNHKFVYKTPAAIIKLPVQYELKDIELP